MKQITLTYFLLLTIASAKAQFDENNAIYWGKEINLGNYFGINTNLNYVYKEKYAFSVGFTGNSRKAKSTPSNYYGGLFGALTLGLTGPKDILETYHIGIGRIYKLNKTGTKRVNLSVGVGYTTIREPTNWQLEGATVILPLSANYTWSYNEYNTMSLIINPRIEFPFLRFYGLTLSPMLQINKDRAYFGIGVGDMIGLLRKKKPEQ
jgi:hypothetical protein